jgi:hypothetical protein
MYYLTVNLGGFVFCVFAKYDYIFNCFTIVSLNLIVFFSSSEPKTQVSFSHHLASFNFLNLDNWNKLGCDNPWMVFLQNYVLLCCLSFKITIKAFGWLNIWTFENISSEPLDYNGMTRNFSSQLSYCLEIFKDQVHILVVFGYWVRRSKFKKLKEDRRQVMRKAHLSLWLWWAKKNN